MPRFSPLRPLVALLVLAGVVQACSGPAAVAPPEPEPVVTAPPPPPGPPFRAVYALAGSIVGHDLRVDAATELVAVAGSVDQRFPSPDGVRSVVVLRTPDSLRVVLVDASRPSAHRVAAVKAPAVVTVAWSFDGSNMAFGHYVPTTRDARPAMGEGDILRVDPVTGAVSRVGCQAARAVLAWQGDGTLLVRDTNNLYVVDADGCATRSTVDARRMHRLAVAPDGSHIAYVYRELVYNRQRRAYEPDSTLMIAAPDGSAERKIVAFRYRPERLAWKADASEVAYDVQHPDRPGVRVISIFDVATGTNAYLHVPTDTSPSELDARWSPGGTRLAFRRADADGTGLAVRTFSDPFAAGLEGTAGADIVGWAAEDALLTRLADGTTRLFRLGSGEQVDLPAGIDPIAVVPR